MWRGSSRQSFELLRRPNCSRVLDVGVQSDGDGLAVNHYLRDRVAVGRGNHQRLARARRRRLLQVNFDEEFVVFYFDFHNVFQRLEAGNFSPLMSYFRRGSKSTLFRVTIFREHQHEH